MVATLRLDCVDITTNVVIVRVLPRSIVGFGEGVGLTVGRVIVVIVEVIVKVNI